MTLIHYTPAIPEMLPSPRSRFVLHESELFGASRGGINGAFFAHRGDTAIGMLSFAFKL